MENKDANHVWIRLQSLQLLFFFAATILLYRCPSSVREINNSFSSWEKVQGDRKLSRNPTFISCNQTSFFLPDRQCHSACSSVTRWKWGPWESLLYSSKCKLGIDLINLSPSSSCGLVCRTSKQCRSYVKVEVHILQPYKLCVVRLVPVISLSCTTLQNPLRSLSSNLMHIMFNAFHCLGFFLCVLYIKEISYFLQPLWRCGRERRSVVWQLKWSVPPYANFLWRLFRLSCTTSCWSSGSLGSSSTCHNRT